MMMMNQLKILMMMIITVVIIIIKKFIIWLNSLHNEWTQKQKNILFLPKNQSQYHESNISRNTIFIIIINLVIEIWHFGCTEIFSFILFWNDIKGRCSSMFCFSISLIDSWGVSSSFQLDRNILSLIAYFHSCSYFISVFGEMFLSLV